MPLFPSSDSDTKGQIFMSHLRWWGVAAVWSIITYNDLIADGFMFLLGPLLILGYFNLEAVLEDRHAAKVREAEGKLTEAELQNMLRGN